MPSWPLSPIDAWLAPAPDPARVAWLKGREFAHRGLHSDGVVENSPSAFAGAIAAGMGIECDVQLTGDGRAVVFHDWELDRLTAETGPLAARTALELSGMVLGQSQDRILTLPELLAQVDGSVPLLIEIKSHAASSPKPLCHAVRRDLEGYRGEAAVMSFDPRVARWYRRHAPETVCGLVMEEHSAGHTAYAWQRYLAMAIAKPDFLAYDIRALPSRFAARQRARGLPVLTWTVRSAALRERAAAYADSPIAEAQGVDMPIGAG